MSEIIHHAFVIEDNPQARRIFTKVLEHQGFKTDCQSQGDLAVEYLTHNKPAIVLLDMHLPVINGNLILQFIRSQPHLSETVVIVISAEYAMSSANDVHADFTLMKPVNTRHLSQLLERVILAKQSKRPA